LLLDEQRSALAMPQSRDDRELLDVALCAAAGSAVFSWSRLDLATGRERIPSFFAAEAIAAARGEQADLDEVIDKAKGRVASTIGWSAPERPEDSIDEAEFDLSSFREACARKGSMAWLKSVSPVAARAIEARQKRWGGEWTDADGINGDYDMHAGIALERWRLGTHAYAPTSLNQFARCPYRFYLSAIAGLRPMEEPHVFQRLDPQLRGHLYHRALFWFFGRDGVNIDDALGKVAKEAADRVAPPIAGVWRTEIEKLGADLKAWLNCREPDWRPMFVELAFGLPNRSECDPKSAPEPVEIANRTLLRGSIDLVERHLDGRIRILDHKTGRPPKKDWGLVVGQSEALQPVLYALAFEALGHGTPVSAALSWATLRGGFRTDEIRFTQDAREKAGKVLAAIDAYLHRGFLPAAPRVDACKECEYLTVCGPWEEKRMEEKDPADLRHLREIRGLR
jgi:RecB family exonuclease